MLASNDLGSEIADIGDLPREELARQWQRIYGHLPPKSLSHDLLVRAISWHLQAKRLGGLPAGTRRQLKQLADQADRRGRAKTVKGVRRASDAQGNANIASGSLDVGHADDEPSVAPARGAAAAKPRRRLSQGARLIRDWNGRSHVVDVIDRGFVYDGKLYSSLTAIAFAITGARWSGPRFFGL